MAVTNVARGARRAWQDDGDVDMQSRALEYHWFRQGVYPNRALEATAPRSLPYSVYLPYAMPMFAAYFEPGGRIQGRVILELLSVACLAVIGFYGHRELRFAGPAMAAIGSVAGAAITGNIGTLAAGQFSIICVALIILQILLLERGNSAAAGVCWSLAMIKPQIALAFALLFVIEKQWRGLLIGLAILAALSLVACAWTDISPLAMANHWLFKASLSFAETAGTPGPGELARSIGANSRTVQMAALMLFGGLMAGLWWASARMCGGIPVLPIAGACGVAGELLFYHQTYDHIMLAPTLFALFALAARSRSMPAIAMAAITAISVWLPMRFLSMLPYNYTGRAVIWSAAAAMLVSWAFREATARSATSAAPGAGTA